MNARLAISIAIGASVSVLVLFLTGAFPHAPWQYLGAPGFVAALLILGPHGPHSVPEIMVPVFAGAINAAIYGLIAFWILARLGIPKRSTRT
jgi:hypothetical protein